MLMHNTTCRPNEKARRRLSACRRPRRSCARLAAASRARARRTALLSMRREKRQHMPASSQTHTAGLSTIASSMCTALAGVHQAAGRRARALAITRMGQGSADSPGCRGACGAEHCLYARSSSRELWARHARCQGSCRTECCRRDRHGVVIAPRAVCAWRVCAALVRANRAVWARPRALSATRRI